MNFLAWIAIASLYKIDPEENEHLKDHCGARHLDVPKLPRFTSTGSAVPRNKYPFIAGLITSLAAGDYRCTGTLISKRHVLTAAHCVYDLSQALKDVGSEEQCTPNGKLLPPLDMTVYLGTKCPKLRKCPNGEKRTTYKARHIIPHPDFTVCPQAANDIAVIELDKDANPEEASPVCMPEEDDSVLGRTVTGIGYGIDARDRPDKFRPGLQELNLAAIYEGDGRIEAKGFEVAMCLGDSGGPLIPADASSKAVLFGITSEGNIDCLLTNPFKDESTFKGTFTDVRHHLDWICDITGVCPLRAITRPSPASNGKVLVIKRGTQRRRGFGRRRWF
ncbi:hypothetical protein Y032_0103g3584 [Ancylostoma ceylanicum]|uniref:Peptidase S1 domain-containing protein n=1 Tax=Ancylostoma ceylanicum TaxID=53326 RepID=A0A016TH25_9BILA|nr:hypothetical protein Y032_0103g3584 [Ancylostoma ceylanicum]